MRGISPCVRAKINQLSWQTHVRMLQKRRPAGPTAHQQPNGINVLHTADRFRTRNRKSYWSCTDEYSTYPGASLALASAWRNPASSWSCMLFLSFFPPEEYSISLTVNGKQRRRYIRIAILVPLLLCGTITGRWLCQKIATHWAIFVDAFGLAIAQLIINYSL